MRNPAVLFLVFFIAAVAVAQAPSSFQPVGTVSQLMLDMIYPTSNAIFYVQRNPPKDDRDWNTLRATALTLAESGNLLMMDTRARDRGAWIRDAQMLIETGRDAYAAAQAKDLNAIVGLNDRLYAACVTCHEQYRPGYRKR